MSEVQIYPAWREAIRRIRQEYKRGDIISHNWLHEALNLPVPNGSTPLDQYKKIQLNYLAAVENIKAELLRNDMMALRAVPGDGYEIVRSADQTEWAETKAKRDISKSLYRLKENLVHVDHNELTITQKAENAEAITRAGALAAALRRAGRAIEHNQS